MKRNFKRLVSAILCIIMLFSMLGGMALAVEKKKINPNIPVPKPVANGIPQKTFETEEYVASIFWQPAIYGGFAYNTAYTAKVKIMPKPTYTLSGVGEFTVDSEYVIQGNAPGEFTVKFGKTEANYTDDPVAGMADFFTVTFNSNGGTSVRTVMVAKYASVREPEAPEKKGYVFKGWYVNQRFTDLYDFDARVINDITLYARWIPEDYDEEAHVCPSAKFSDLDASLWYHEATDYIIGSGIMYGTSSDKFTPNGILTRAMLVTVLHRMENQPETDATTPFADVSEPAYYSDAVSWAYENGIVKGVSMTRFAPDEEITREQLAAIIHRYATYKEYDVSVGENTNILSYDDFDSISEYAIGAMQYAAGAGLISGRSESTLNPKETATRVETAAILYRFRNLN